MNIPSVKDAKVAAIQLNSGADLAANLLAAERALAEAATAGAVLAVLPENFAYMGARDTDKLAHAEVAGRGPIQDFLGATAQRLGLWIVAGTLPIKSADAGKVCAASLVLDAQGKTVARYDKIHLFDVLVGEERYRESATIAAGAIKLVVVDTPVGRLGLSVCYDLRFPELYRALAAQGAEILCVPSAFTRRTGEAHWEILLRARAVENLCYVIAPGQAGTHPGGRATYGNSLIVDPWGEVLARRPEGTGAVLASLSSTRLAELRQTFPVLQHRRMPSH